MLVGNKFGHNGNFEQANKRLCLAWCCHIIHKISSLFDTVACTKSNDEANTQTTIKEEDFNLLSVDMTRNLKFH